MGARYKTETTILTEKGPEGNFIEFGSVAEERYLDRDDTQEFDLYKNFKMTLNNPKVRDI